MKEVLLLRRPTADGRVVNKIKVAAPKFDPLLFMMQGEATKKEVSHSPLFVIALGSEASQSRQTRFIALQLPHSTGPTGNNFLLIVSDPW